MSFTGDSIKDLGFDINKPDFRELDLGSPVSPLRVQRHHVQAATSSSSSSGSYSGRSRIAFVANRSDGAGNGHSGELSGSSESSPTAIPADNLRSGRGMGSFKSSHSPSSESSGSRPALLIGGSVNSPPPPPQKSLPAGNICPSGKIMKTGMANRSTKTDVLGSGTGNYGHGSIMWGAGGAKSSNRDVNATKLRGIASGDHSPAKSVSALSGVMDQADELKLAGNEQYKKGHFSEALSLYDKAISLSPGNAAYRSNRAAALTGLGRLAEAVKECEEAVRLDPKYCRAHQRLGSLLIRLGQVDNARRHLCFSGQQTDPAEMHKLQALEKHLNRCQKARMINDWKSVLAECDAAIAAGADSSPQLYTCRAEALLKLNQLDDAVLTLSSAAKFDLSSHLNSQYKLFGMLYETYFLFVQTQIDLAFGRFDNAVTAAEKASQADPRNVEVAVLLSNVKLVTRARVSGNELFKAERFTEACSAYGEGLKLNLANAVLYCNKAACWFKLGRWERSIEDCNHALIIRPNYLKALLRRAASYIKLEKWVDAVRDYEVLRKELPDDNEVAESLFHAQVALKKSLGEEIFNMKFGGEVEEVSDLEQFRAATSSPGVSVVHFKSTSNEKCDEISQFINTLCLRYPSVNFLKVVIEENPLVASTENVRVTPTFKIYKNGSRVKEMICPTHQVLEYSVRHYSS